MSEVTKAPDFKVSRFQLGSLVTNLPFPAVPGPERVNQAAEFRAPSASDLGTPRFFAMQLDEVMLPNEPLITVTSSKNIVKTVVAGGDFTVKEIIGADDWQIKIQGYAVKEGNRAQAVASSLVPQDYPEEWLRRLVMLYRRNRQLEVKCQLLTYFNISSLVIENIEFPAIAGASDHFAYQISASSDESSLAKLLRKK
ncbi:DUF6046 domain-containing protein [Hymenobacter glacieicola]|uniref:DUF6046 domain-containing protein n=1 Tax=Hymenobacter glacieicola TaxID=1562124 RepID=A0ABQ1WK04_9BACT|nr:DUF6046 domain-containing protein [Hymenobacter glacieicola]GGG33409.1 hypothetical protein GCM10011378_07360 [Hymenobacter glacieicola]